MDVLLKTAIISYDPLAAFGIIPFLAPFFSFPVPRHILFRDPVGTHFEMMVRYVKGYLCVDDDWHNLGWYYGLRLGGWLQVTFFDQSTLLIRVEDRCFREVYYPRPAVFVSLPTIDPDISAFQQMHVSTLPSNVVDEGCNSGVVNDGFTPHNNQFFYYCMSKELLDTDLSSLLLPGWFCKKSVPVGTPCIFVLDEWGHTWFCNLTWRASDVEDVAAGLSDPECIVGSEWADICVARGLGVGSRIRVGFPQDCYDIMYLTIESFAPEDAG